MVALELKSVVTVPEAVAGISHTYMHIITAMTLFKNTCDQATLILPKRQDQKSLMLGASTFSRCSREGIAICYSYTGGQ